jgi:hypothetical protein
MSTHFNAEMAKRTLYAIGVGKYGVDKSPYTVEKVNSMTEDVVHKRIGDEFSFHFDGNVKSLNRLAEFLVIPGAGSMKLKEVIPVIGTMVDSLLQGSTHPNASTEQASIVAYSGQGPMEIQSLEGMGMSYSENEFNYLLTVPDIPLEEFRKRVEAVLSSEGFNRRFEPMLFNALEKCEAKQAATVAKDIMSANMRMNSAKDIRLCSEGLAQAKRQEGQATKIFRLLANKIGLVIPDGTDHRTTMEAVHEHCDKLAAQAMSSDLINLIDENEAMLKQFEDLVLSDDED